MQKSEGLPDTPGEPFPDTYLIDGSLLTRRGRTSATHFATAESHSTYAGQDGTAYYAMRRTMCTYSEVEKRWLAPLGKAAAFPIPRLAERLAAIMGAKSGQELDTTFAKCGMDDPMSDEMHNLHQLLAEHVLVMVGPGAREYWSLHTQVVRFQAHNPGARVQCMPQVACASMARESMCRPCHRGAALAHHLTCTDYAPFAHTLPPMAHVSMCMLHF